MDLDQEYGGKAPWFVRAVFFALFGLFLAHWLLIFSVPYWAPAEPDFEHTVEFRMKGGLVHYLSPGIGWATNYGLFVFVGLFVLLFAFVKIHARLYRERVRRGLSSGDMP